ncbi:helix-hairpin-helix domain-containing protein [Halosolutus halophilus]|uniref:helix-hairpin-helix domain-containing protein n=1 Tax=Halosolutus halophilus TaxID=1552990 RepID=UPI002234ED93|nr:helix-hairpin-helix domain-containing protein [Halosolutus halophilus]
MSVAVTVDDREPAGLLAAVRDHPDVTSVSTDRLPAGDIAVDSVGIERKTPRDYVSSVMARSGPDLYDQARLVDYAIRLARKHSEEPSTRRLPVGAVSSRREPTAKRMYGCIEGIGPELAETLYEAYPAVAALADASRAELLAIDGIGETRARAIRAALDDSRIEIE